ncbi:hypothetical protein WCP94_002152 [Bilophila wadsworthia]
MGASAWEGKRGTALTRVPPAPYSFKGDFPFETKRRLTARRCFSI